MVEAAERCGLSLPLLAVAGRGVRLTVLLCVHSVRSYRAFQTMGASPPDDDGLPA